MNQRIKILYIIPAEGFGGAERQSLLHIRNLPGCGVDVVAVTGPGKRVFDNVRDTAAKVIYCPHFPAEYGRPFELFSFLLHAGSTVVRWIRTLRFLIHLNRKEQVDLVFASRATGWILAAPLSRLFSVPCIWRFGSRVHGRLAIIAFKLFGAVLKPDAAIANCKSVADSVGKLINVPTTVIYNGIDSQMYNQATAAFNLREKAGVGSDTAVIGLAARPSPDKGMDFLADSIKHIDSMNRRGHLCVAGEFGWRRQIQAEFDKRGLASKVTFLGYVTDIRSFYMGCDIVVLTSREQSIEGFPNALMEAMALGRPVVATNVGGIPELIDNGRNGVIVSEMNAVEFAEKIVHLIDNPDERVRIGDAAKKAIANRYSVEHTVTPIAQLIASLLGVESNKIANPEPVVSSLPIGQQVSVL